MTATAASSTVLPIADVVVIGAGPAGLAAAVTAADRGLSVVLVDAGAQPGGQYWRQPDPALVRPAVTTGDPVFRAWRSRLDTHVAAGRIDHRSQTQVWYLERSGQTRWVVRTTATFGPSDSAVVIGTALVLAPGGYDRQLPIPGWDLPGVMAAGGVQALLKGQKQLAGRRVAVAGTGPFLFPVATGLVEAGAAVVGIFECNSPFRWLRGLAGAARVPSKGAEGARYAATLLRHRVPYRPRTVITAILGTDRAEAVLVSRVDRRGVPTGVAVEYPVDLVALGWGFTPSLELPLMVGADTAIGDDGSLVAVVDDAQRSTVPGVYIAGEATGVGGAVLSVAEGELAGLTVAADAGVPGEGAAELARRIRRHRAFARAMHIAHPMPQDWAARLPPDTMICRCEEVPLSRMHTAHGDLGAQDTRTMKLLTRTGMGWCQGRVCGLAVAGVCASLTGRPTTVEDLRSASKRPLAAPVTLAELSTAETALTPTTDHPPAPITKEPSR